MKWISYDLKMLFQSGYALKADLFTFTLVDGTVLTFTSFDISLTSPRNGLVYSSAFEQVERSKISWKNDLSVSTMELTINIQTQYQVENMSFLSAFRTGLFDGASVFLERAVMPGRVWTAPSTGIVYQPTQIVGIIPMFLGDVGDIQGGRSKLTIPINCITELFDTVLPKQMYQSACLHTVYDTGCALTKATYTSSTTISAVVNNTILTFSSPSRNIGYFSQGYCKFTSGVLSGRTMGILYDGSASVQFYESFPFTPSVGDSVQLIAGCDQQLSTCTQKFGNQTNFLGCPYIPTVETAL